MKKMATNKLLFLLCLVVFVIWFQSRFVASVAATDFPVPKSAALAKHHDDVFEYDWPKFKHPEEGLPTSYLLALKLHGWKELKEEAEGFSYVFKKGNRKVTMVVDTSYFSFDITRD